MTDILKTLKSRQRTLEQAVMDLRKRAAETEKVIQGLDADLDSLPETERNRLIQIYASDLRSFAKSAEQRAEILAHHLVPIKEYLAELEAPLPPYGATLETEIEVAGQTLKQTVQYGSHVT